MAAEAQEREAAPLLLAALAVALASGAAAMTHELLWTRRMIDLIGASAESTARVFSCFFLGLALGAALANRFAARTRRPWRAVAVIEAGVGLLALPALTLPFWSAGVWPALGPEALTAWQGSATKLGLSVIIVVPPSVLMGMALPLLARALLGGTHHLGRHGVWLYGTNTVGGVVGLTVTTAFALDWLGITGAMGAAMAINALAAGAALLMDLRTGPLEAGGTPQAQPAERTPRDGLPRWGVFTIAFTSGFGVLAVEMQAVHMLGHVIPGAVQANSALLATVIGMLAAAALVVPALVTHFGPAERVLGPVLAVVAFATVCSPLIFFAYTDGLQLVPAADTMFGFVVRITATTLVAFGPAVFLAGLVFPLTLGCLDHSDPSGRQFGWLLAVNGVGGFLGVEVAQALLMPRAGMYAGVGVVAFVYALAALCVAWSSRRPLQLLLPLAAAFFVAVLVPTRLTDLSQLAGPLRDRGYQVVQAHSGREGTVLVTVDRSSGHSLVLPGGYVLGNEAAVLRQRRQAHLPLLLHPEPKSVAFIALATGIPAGAALAHPSVEAVVAIELWPQVAEAAATHFAETNRGIATDPRARIVAEDGRTYLASTTDSFDVVIGDFFLPWRSGVGRLHSAEHYQAVRTSLREGGLFCQWYPLFDMSREQIDLAFATFVRVFGRAHLFRAAFDPSFPAVALCGFRAGDLDWQGLPDRTGNLLDSDQERYDALMLDPTGVQLLYVGIVDPGQTTDQPTNTLGNARFELAGGRLRMTGDWVANSVRQQRWLDLEDAYALAPPESASVESGVPVADLVHLGRMIGYWRQTQLLAAQAMRAGDTATAEHASEAAARMRERIDAAIPPGVRDAAGMLPPALSVTLR